MASSRLSLCGVALASDGMTIPLGGRLYATDEEWAEDARDMLTTLAS